VIQYIKQCVLAGISDQSKDIQKTSGTIITTMVSIDIQHAPEIFQTLLSIIESSQNPSSQEVKTFHFS
jgi:hypothetical protein